MRLPGRLPDRPVRRVLVSGEYPELAQSLEKLGVEAIWTEPDSRLPQPVRWHPDMQVCALNGELFVGKGNPLRNRLEAQGIPCRETQRAPGLVYPQDVLCNVLTGGNWAMGNRKTVDPAIWQAINKLGWRWLSVRQGYAACSCALVDHSSAITGDPGIGPVLENTGVKVLRLTPGGVSLPGYAYGFLGGCCGLLAPNVMAFAGRLDSHPEGGLIRDFLQSRGIRVVELLSESLLDVGGILPLA